MTTNREKGVWRNALQLIYLQASSRSRMRTMTTNRETPPHLPPMPVGPRLPQELVDQVIDHLHDDLDALKQCSLVSKAWEPSSTLHLYSTLPFPPYCHWPYTSGEQSCTLHSSGAEWTELIELLSSSPRIRNTVRKLRLTGWRYIARADPSFYETKTDLSRGILVTILDALPRLRVLELNNFFLDEETLSSPPSATYSRSLDELILDPVFYTDPLHTNAFLLLFSRVDCLVLRLEPIDGEQWPDTLSTPIPRCSATVGSLKLFCSGLVDLAKAVHALQKLVTAPLQSVTFRDSPRSFGGFDNPTSTMGTMIPSVFGGPCPLPDFSELRFALVTCDLRLTLSGVPESRSFLSWDYMTRDIRLLAQPRLESLAIDLRIVSTVPRNAESPGVNEVGNGLRLFLRRTDWGALVATIGQCCSIGQLKIQLRLVGPHLDSSECATLIDICRRIASQHLGTRITNILDVGVV